MNPHVDVFTPGIPPRGWRAVYVAALLAACLVVLPGELRAGLTPPAVPPDLALSPAEYKLFFAAHAVGTQNYTCLPKGDAFAWTPAGPQATLFNKSGTQVATHFLSPNPDEPGTTRATWQHSDDTSAVWAKAIETVTDPTWVEPGAIPWLLLEVVGWSDGESPRRLARATRIQRVNTEGGTAPETGCAEAGDVGDRAFVPYETDYYFYKARPGAE